MQLRLYLLYVVVYLIKHLVAHSRQLILFILALNEVTH